MQYNKDIINMKCSLLRLMNISKWCKYCYFVKLHIYLNLFFFFMHYISFDFCSRLIIIFNFKFLIDHYFITIYYLIHLFYLLLQSQFDRYFPSHHCFLISTSSSWMRFCFSLFLHSSSLYFLCHSKNFQVWSIFILNFSSVILHCSKDQSSMKANHPY